MSKPGFSERVKRRLECWLKGFHPWGSPPFPRAGDDQCGKLLPVHCPNCGKLAPKDDIAGMQEAYEQRREEVDYMEHAKPGGGMRPGYTGGTGQKP